MWLPVGGRCRGTAADRREPSSPLAGVAAARRRTRGQRFVYVVQAAGPGTIARQQPVQLGELSDHFGVLPLVFATGSGAGSRHSLGTTVLGGMIASTFLNLVFIPVLYVVIDGWRERRSGGGREPARMQIVAPPGAPPANGDQNS